MATAAKKKRRVKSGRPGAGMAGQLREIIGGRGLSAYSVGGMAGVSASVVSRFLSRERGLTLESFDAIAGALGLRLIETARGKARPPKPARSAGDRPAKEDQDVLDGLATGPSPAGPEKT